MSRKQHIVVEPEPGGCDQHPTAGRVGRYCLGCVLIPGPLTEPVEAALAGEASTKPPRPSVDTITSDELDSLYDQMRAAVRALGRLQALAYRWEHRDAADLPYARSLRAAIAGPGPDQPDYEASHQ
ncbi:hypothetical protein AQJ30_27455 [Streptomyces longwoodensis]|uniref:Uncharacterized protein n=1 Tax=Streptomyces longwoodensis TaxID=68231 RepID=A0A124HQB3_9ACTN|nr:hypothetical protein [Streptomyces longwoodensis]KUN34812.1 hypothetical protein AQJ30_27455 [Streptomyces longwoodensis]